MPILGGFGSDVSVTVSPPDLARPQSQEDTVQINLFLFQVTPSAAWRNEPLPGQAKRGEAGFPPLALDLHYLITAYAPNGDGIEAHRLLGRALSALHDHPVLGEAELRELVHADLHQQVERIRLTPQAIPVEEMSKLWSMFQKPYNISVVWKASVVLIESTRGVRAALPVLTLGPADTGVTVRPDLGPVTPGLESLAPPAGQPSLRLGESLRINGHLLAGDQVRAAITSSRWSATQYLSPTSVSDRTVTITLPAGVGAEASFPAGLYTVSLGVVRGSGDPEFLTNQLPFALAPSLTSILPTSGSPDGSGIFALTATVSPQVRPDQRISLFAGSLEFKPQSFPSQTSTLQFKLGGLGPGKYRLRLRVDGVDSIVVDRTTSPPSYVGPVLEVA